MAISKLDTYLQTAPGGRGYTPQHEQMLRDAEALRAIPPKDVNSDNSRQAALIVRESRIIEKFINEGTVKKASEGLKLNLSRVRAMETDLIENFKVKLGLSLPNRLLRMATVVVPAALALARFVNATGYFPHNSFLSAPTNITQIANVTNPLTNVTSLQNITRLVHPTTPGTLLSAAMNATSMSAIANVTSEAAASAVGTAASAVGAVGAANLVAGAVAVALFATALWAICKYSK